MLGLLALFTKAPAPEPGGPDTGVATRLIGIGGGGAMERGELCGLLEPITLGGIADGGLPRGEPMGVSPEAGVRGDLGDGEPGGD